MINSMMQHSSEDNAGICQLTDPTNISTSDQCYLSAVDQR